MILASAYPWNLHDPTLFIFTWIYLAVLTVAAAAAVLWLAGQIRRIGKP